MRIDELRLTAFGPFTDIVLDLSGGRQGIHLIYGHNEAGKSSALRALRCMLYGIPARSNDDFIHPYAKMRVGAVLRSQNGEVLELVRRKGRTHTLHGPGDDTVVEEHQLKRILKGIDEQFFSTMFGIGYDDLVRGGREIIHGGGNLGRLIFSAGSGIVNLHEIQSEIQTEADQLFRPSGKKPKINAMLARFKTGKRELKDAQLPGRKWEIHDQSLKKALRRKEKVESERETLEKDINRLTRIKEALPIMARRTELLLELKAHNPIPLLPDDFPEKRRDLMAQLGIAEMEKQGALKTITASGDSISQLVVPQVILDHAVLIEALYQELGSQRKAAKDRINLEVRQNTLSGEAGEILISLRDDLTLEEAENLRVRRDEIVLIQELSAQYERIVTRLQDNREKLPGLSVAIQKAHEDLDAIPVPVAVDELHSELREAEPFGLQEKHNREDRFEVQALFRTAEKEQQRLGLEKNPPELIESLCFPSSETVLVYEDHFNSLQRTIDDFQKELNRAQDLLIDIGREIETGKLEKEVPSEKDLEIARKRRDRGWKLISRKLIEDEVSAAEIETYLSGSSDAKTLVKTFEEDMQTADTLADRLRREADRVAAKARLLAEKRALVEQSEQLTKNLRSCEEKKEQLATEWAAEWKLTGVQPRTPKEMGAWLQELRALTDKLSEAANRRERCDGLKRDIDLHRSNLRRCLGNHAAVTVNAEYPLSRLISVAAQVIAKQEKRLQQREKMSLEIRHLERELTTEKLRLSSNEQTLETWRERWKNAVRSLGLKGDALPKQAAAVMEELNVLFEKLKEAGILKKRIEGIDRDVEIFAAQVMRLVSELSPELKNRPPEEAVLELHRRVKHARDARAKQKTLEKQVEQEQIRLAKGEKSISLVSAQLASMCAEAGCEDIQQLPELEKQSIRRKKTQEKLATTDEQLRRLSAGATIERFVDQARSVDPDAIDGEIRRLDEILESLNREKSILDQTIGSEHTELKRMDGSAKAALIEEENQTLLGGLDREIEKYARLKIAAKVLAIAIERYRDKSQGPVLKRASSLFRQITDGSFEALRAEFDQDGMPVLVGIRPITGEIVHVDGMSDGTADQLYLALRLSGLEMYLENNEAIPFVMDDILIKFDDMRAAAALKTLAAVSEKTQIIFFTHHRHLVELAEKHIDSEKLFIQKLNFTGE